MGKVARKRIIELTRRYESTALNTFSMGENPPLFVRGEGPFLFTEEGERFVDLIAGSAVTNLGHGLPAHREAIARATERGIYHTGTRLAHVERAELYDDLASVLPESLSRFHLVSVGTEAVETAIKAAQYHTRRPRLFAFEGGYHGRTVGALSITHSEHLHRIFSTLKDVVTFIPYPYQAGAEAGVDEGALMAFCLETLEQRLVEAKAADDLPSSIILEAIQGTSGAVRPPAGFLREVRALADRYDVLLIVDEIWTGFGRTGKWFAFEHDGVVPDLVCLSKGLTAGLPLAGVAGREDILGAWPAGIHTSTFQGNPIACAMARATIAEMKAKRWVEHAAGPIANGFETRLAPLRERSAIRDARRIHDARSIRNARRIRNARCIRDVRWVGAAAAIEFADAQDAPDPATRRAVQQACFDRQLLVYGGGRHGNTIMLLPPINIDVAVLDGALEQIVDVIDSVI
ncbi:MAG: aspartate aminotransferase family protein [Alphaproteobacteria bacterium]|nr:aspartate aminotransferase family protein [Alphaproteobacteria bacterium]